MASRPWKEKLVKPFIPDNSFYATDAFTDWSPTWLEAEVHYLDDQGRLVLAAGLGTARKVK